MFLTNEGLLLTIEDMETNLISDRIDLIQVGYMQASCNAEGFVDFGDAIRIVLDENYTDVPGGRRVPCRYHKDSLRLYATIMEIRCRKMWNDEFPGSRAR